MMVNAYHHHIINLVLSFSPAMFNEYVPFHCINFGNYVSSPLLFGECGILEIHEEMFASAF